MLGDISGCQYGLVLLEALGIYLPWLEVREG